MQTQSNPNPQPQFPIQVLDQIEVAIQASQRWLTTLQGRRDVGWASTNVREPPRTGHS